MPFKYPMQAEETRCFQSTHFSQVTVDIPRTAHFLKELVPIHIGAGEHFCILEHTTMTINVLQKQDCYHQCHRSGCEITSRKKSQHVQNTRSESLCDYVPTGKATPGISFKKTPQNQPMGNFLRPMVALAEESSGRRAQLGRRAAFLLLVSPVSLSFWKCSRTPADKGDFTPEAAVVSAD